MTSTVIVPTHPPAVSSEQRVAISGVLYDSLLAAADTAARLERRGVAGPSFHLLRVCRDIKELAPLTWRGCEECYADFRLMLANARAAR